MARDRIKERMYNALCLAGMQFRRYETEHTAKADARGIGDDIRDASLAKAETNRNFADLCEGAALDSVE